MKPKDLKFPFSWEKRHVHLSDRVLYVPDYYDQYSEFTFPGWESIDLFGNHNPVTVEYCSGNGAWIVQKAKDEPCRNWVAIERRFDRVRKIWSKIKNEDLQNLVVFCGEGFQLTKEFIPSSSVEEIYINFPDPWPKKRHAKHRIVQSPFVNEIHRVLKIKGAITLVTDDPVYSKQMIEVLQLQPGMEAVNPSPFYVTCMDGYGTSFFDTLWRGKGRAIRYHQYKKAG